MPRIAFNASPSLSLGVEIELALVDRSSGALTSAAPQLLDALPEMIGGAVKPELMQCYIELNTGVCQTTGEAIGQLRNNLKTLHRVADPLGVDLLWSATHPFSSWKDQQVTDAERYHSILAQIQDAARQLITFGLHVHVGVDSGDKAVMLCDRMLRFLPVLLSASCNSPFWEARDTGLQSWRTRVMEGLPTAGLPPFMRNWSEYAWLLNHLVDTEFIRSIREIWWDIRPHHNFGTVEIRICDMPGSLGDVAGLVAIMHCLVKKLSDEIDEGTYQYDCHPMMVRQNKWRASRYGSDANLVDSDTYQLVPARQVIRELAESLLPVSTQLGCETELNHLLSINAHPNWSQRQRNRYNQAKNPAELVRWMVDQARSDLD
ncbi:MAG: YbdK family carboxylate-amine ligase [Planctomycetaceae bacterium]|nr:MAG: YbdK family carboxylate-amine ligase [Planctomycetaceae bacterium]